MSKKDYDFAGWVTKNEILCDDGRTIKPGAFVGSPESVPLVWNHDASIPGNILGTMHLEHSAEGTYGYGYFNGTETADHAKQMINHGDINAMSIRANKLVEQAKNVVGGAIREVSLVMNGANPGALIDTIISHSGDDSEEAIIYTGLELMHSADSLPKEEEPEVPEENTEVENTEEKTVQDVVDTLTDEQLTVVEILIGMGIEEALKEEDPEEEKETENEEKETENKEGDGTDMKHNSFENNGSVVGAKVININNVNEPTMTGNELLHAAQEEGHNTLQHAAKAYGIADMSLLFPDAVNSNGVYIMEDKNTNVTKILGMVAKSPFPFVKTIIADLDENYMRAKGYVTATRKEEDVFKLLGRKIGPTTIYKKQKLDRDDIIDITDVNVTNLVQGTMRPALMKEIVRAIFVGDGRAYDHKDKINEENIIPIIKDDGLYVAKYEVANVEAVLESVMYALTDYQGEGTPALFCSPTLAVSLKLAKTATGKYLFGDIPTYETMASKMGVSEIVPTSILGNNDVIIVNLNDYGIGTSNGGEVTNFDQFDIDYNQYKFLIETRLSGALKFPKAAIYMKVKEVKVTKPSLLVELDEGDKG